MNHITVMGNLTKEVDVRFTANQKTIAYFDIAENVYDYKKKERVPQYYKVVAFGKNAENIAEYFSKGSKIKIDGNLRHESFTNDKGEEKSFWRIQLEHFEFCTSKKSTEKKAEK